MLFLSNPKELYGRQLPPFFMCFIKARNEMCKYDRIKHVINTQLFVFKVKN